MERTEGKFTLWDEAGFRAWLGKQHPVRKIQVIQNHHTYKPGYAEFNGSNHFKLQDGMEKAHLLRQFAEIGQHFTTFPDGTVMSGRSLDKDPAGIKGANGAAVCIENIGNFDAAGDAMSLPQRSIIVSLVAQLCERFSVPLDVQHVVYHHWFDLETGKRHDGKGTSKSCPGTAFFGGNQLLDCEREFLPLLRDALGQPALALNELVPESDTLLGALWRAKVTAETLSVRNAPNGTGVVLRTLTKGSPVDVFEVNQDWVRIDAQQAVWCSAKFIERV